MFSETGNEITEDGGRITARRIGVSVKLPVTKRTEYLNERF